MKSAVVDLEMRPDDRDPQFTAIWGIYRNTRLKIGQLHNTALGVDDGVKNAFKDIRYYINERMGIPKDIKVIFGNLTYTLKIPKKVLSKLIRNIEKIGLNITGFIGEKDTLKVNVKSSSSPLSMYGNVTGLSIAEAVHDALKIVGFGVMQREEFLLFASKVSEIIKDRANKLGYDLSTPAVVEGFRARMTFPRIQYKLANIATALRDSDRSDVALTQAAKDAADIIMRDLW